MKYGNAVLAWMPLALAVTGICALVYMVVQQNYRQSLNDPQVQMAEDAARALSEGEVPAAVVPRGVMIDSNQSLAPWIAVYDESGKVLESNGTVDGAPPMPPQGVFDAARIGQGKGTDISGQNRVSWESSEGTRNAIVIQRVGGKHPGFVVAGRNMYEVEERESRLSTTVFVSWLVLLAATLLMQFISTWFRREQ